MTVDETMTIASDRGGSSEISNTQKLGSTLPATAFANTEVAVQPTHHATDEPSAGAISQVTDTAVGTTESPPSRESSNATLPDRVGRYVVLRQLGAGGMGVVVEAYDPELDRKLALKLLRDHQTSGSPLRLIREAQALARLSHPNVVQVHDVGFDGDRVFIAMELIQGQTLGEWMRGEKRPWRDVVKMFVETAEGLQAAHAVGLIHRDFKPANVLIDRQGRPRVVDFGLARELSFETQKNETVPKGLLPQSMTRTGAIMGTPAYMAPEQWLGQQATPASDLFAFCIALFEALYGTRPFDGDTLGALSQAVQDGNWVPPSKPGIPTWLVAVLRRGLATSPTDRFASMEELIGELRRDRQRTRRRIALAITFVAAMTGVGFGAWTLAGQAPCTGVDKQLTEVWHPAVQAEIAGKLDDEQLQTRVVDGLSSYADAWHASAGEACQAHARQEVSSDIYGQQLRCHERARRSLVQAITSVTGGEMDLRQAPAMVTHLPALAFCNDLEVLAAEVPPPEDTQQAYRVEQLQGRLAELYVMAHAGQTERALQEVRDLNDRVEALDYPPLTAERELREGQIALVALQWEQAYDVLDQALNTAIAARRDDIAAEAQARLLFLTSRGGDTKAALTRRGLAEALMRRVHGRPDLEAMLLSNVGLTLLNSGDRDAAEELLTQAVDVAESTQLANPIDIAWNYRVSLANVITDETRKHQLLDRSKAELSSRLGPGHSMVLKLRYLIATMTSSPEQGLQRLAGTCEVLASDYPELANECLECGALRAQFFDAMDHPREAAKALQQALSCSSDDEWSAAVHRLFAAERALFLGDAAAAEQQFAASMADFAPYLDEWWNRVSHARALTGRGRALIALGRAEQAVPYLEQARKTLGPIVTSQGRPKYQDLRMRATEALALALVQIGSSQARVTELRAEVKAYYRSAGPGYRNRLTELERPLSADQFSVPGDISKKPHVPGAPSIP